MLEATSLKGKEAGGTFRSFSLFFITNLVLNSPSRFHEHGSTDSLLVCAPADNKKVRAQWLFLMIVITFVKIVIDGDCEGPGLWARGGRGGH